MERRHIEGTWEKNRAFSPAVVVHGGTMVFVAGHGGFVDDQGKSLAGNFDDPIDDHLRGQRGKHLRTRRLHLYQPEAGQFLHGQVDLRGRHAAFAAQRRGVCHAAQHERHEGFSLVERQPDVFELVRIGQVHGAIIYYYE